MANGQFALWLSAKTDRVFAFAREGRGLRVPQITVRDGKGARDRVTVLPDVLVEPLQVFVRKTNG